MGINVSRNENLADNEYLKSFVGKNHINITSSHTVFWENLLKYHIQIPENR